MAVDHGTSDYTVRDATYPETLAFKHTQIALFAGWQGGGFSLDGAAAYGLALRRLSLATPATPGYGDARCGKLVSWRGGRLHRAVGRYCQRGTLGRGAPCIGRISKPSPKPAAPAC
ncbi:MAG: hypothetical protein IPL18_15030 [Sphingomonadales bacterium]|nr:hypothetical protein [Sphingomonadales bacterium]